MSLFFFRRRASTPDPVVSRYFQLKSISLVRQLYNAQDVGRLMEFDLSGLCVGPRSDTAKHGAKTWKVNFYSGYDSETFSGLDFTNLYTFIDSITKKICMKQGTSQDANPEIYYPVAGQGSKHFETYDYPLAYYAEVVETPTTNTTSKSATSGTVNSLTDTTETDFRTWVEIGDKVTITNPSRIDNVLSRTAQTLTFVNSGTLITSASSYIIELKARKSILYLDSQLKDARWAQWSANGRAYENADNFTIICENLKNSLNPSSTSFVACAKYYQETGSYNKIPGWSSMDEYVAAYCTVSPTYLSAYNATGGAVQFSRYASDWVYWTGGSWATCHAGKWLQRFYVYDNVNNIYGTSTINLTDVFTLI